jgi:hypothetical protein
LSRGSRALAGAAVLLCAACASEGAPSHRRPEDAGTNRDSRAVDAVAESAVSCPLVESISGAEVSFTEDLMPFFGVTCAFGGCHDGDTRQAGLYLGPNVSKGPADAATEREVHESLLSPATTTKDLPRVTPHDPSRSLLMLKVQGCQNAVGLTCGDRSPGEPCGARMPYLSDPLAPEKRAMLARWIAQGARFSLGD